VISGGVPGDEGSLQYASPRLDRRDERDETERRE